MFTFLVAWIRGTDQLAKSRFIWKESGADFTYTNLGKFNPDNLLGEDCVEMGSDGNWNDLSCNDKLVFICEQNLK